MKTDLNHITHSACRNTRHPVRTVRRPVLRADEKVLSIEATAVMQVAGRLAEALIESAGLTGGSESDGPGRLAEAGCAVVRGGSGSFRSGNIKERAACAMAASRPGELKNLPSALRSPEKITKNHKTKHKECTLQ